jgi:putative PIN family toxin of toxin-antitoxin system
VVLDTNVVVSALVFEHGHLAWLRHASMGARSVPLSSKATAEEILRVLGYPKFQLSGEDIQLLLADYLPFVEMVEVKGARVSVPAPPDPDDRIFLELALVGEAAFLVTGDRSLRDMASLGKCRIVSPAEFRAALEATGAKPWEMNPLP